MNNIFYCSAKSTYVAFLTLTLITTNYCSSTFISVTQVPLKIKVNESKSNKIQRVNLRSTLIYALRGLTLYLYIAKSRKGINIIGIKFYRIIFYNALH